MTILRRSTLPILLSLALVQATAGSLCADDRPHALIAKATHIILADSQSSEPHPQSVALVKAGTPLLAFAETKRIKSIKHRLVLTNTGLWGYLVDDEAHFWNPSEDEPFVGTKDVVVVQDFYAASSQISEGVRITRILEPNDTFRYIGEAGDGYTIKIDELGNILREHEKAYFIIPKNIARRVTVGQTPVPEDIRDFNLSTYDGVAGIFKECDTSVARAIKLGVGAGFSLEKFFAFLRIEATAEVSQVTTYEPTVNVTRQYYTRENINGYYKVTKIQDCATNKKVFRFVDPYNEEVTINPEFAKVYGVIEDLSGQMRVSCPREQIQFEQAIKRRGGFLEEDIPFIVSRTAHVVDYDTYTCSEVPSEG